MEIANGIWPVMITPFDNHRHIDFEGVNSLVDWYIQEGCNGIFAVCQSSEMFFLDLYERVELAKAVVRFTNGRIPIVISGHISNSFDDQKNELCQLADAGADGLVLVSNRFVEKENDSDSVFIGNLKKMLEQLPNDIYLGFYECPYPFKRILSPDVLKFCADSGRFRFIKDTSCDITNIQEKLEILSHTDIKIFNAYTATLLDSLKLGASGYSGVMANFHPRLYQKLWQLSSRDIKRAEYLQGILDLSSVCPNSV